MSWRRGIIRAWLAVTLVALAGCAGVTTPQTRYYLLEADAPAAPAATQGERDRVVVRPVEVASFLAQNGVVVTTGNAVEAASYHRWAEPLSAGLQRFVIETLRAALPQFAVSARANGQPSGKQLVVRTQFAAFQGTLAGAAVVAGSYLIEDGDGSVLLERAFDLSRPLPGPGYDALVTELATALAEICARIAADVGTVAR